MKKYKVEGRKIINICLLSLIFIVLLSNIFATQLEYLLYLKPKITEYNVTQVHFIDVGQGDSILIEFPFNRGNILIDTGGNDSYSIIKNITISYLKKRGIKNIEYLIISHGDYDHMGGAINLINNY